MNMLHLFLLLPLGWFVLVAVNPKVQWHVRSWAYRDPEANEPSDTAFMLYRLGAVVMVVFCLVLWVQALDLSSSNSASSRPEASSSPSPEESEPIDTSVDLHRLTTADSDHGRISGYNMDESGIALYIDPGACAGNQASATVVEQDTETVILSATIYSSNAFCGSEPRVVRADVRTDVAVDGRDVVDVDGEPIRLCNGDCS
ncbi:hypothetical protein [Nocardiopsis dassonvillei]|uniref:hypothetical protein n=1 Tax=Nocardiopsis dassonvillei TaxID=2014 RepID=UPI00340DD1FB